MCRYTLGTLATLSAFLQKLRSLANQGVVAAEEPTPAVWLCSRISTDGAVKTPETAETERKGEAFSSVHRPVSVRA